ncbi:amidase family protein [Kyrpidia spormannii]|uniref:Uncharacterized protein n=1 Tax=Kyrpidia spormannii TaxID=2055160 RepID=A0A6F9EFD5_9BACL|nr:protein of unknown function [Kyrpidia spormannii]
MTDYMTVLEMLSALERGTMTREELATRVWERLDVLEPKVQAFLYVDPEAADRIADPPGSGPLSGIPVGVKDMIDVAGSRRPGVPAPITGCRPRTPHAWPSFGKPGR